MLGRRHISRVPATPAQHNYNVRPVLNRWHLTPMCSRMDKKDRNNERNKQPTTTTTRILQVSASRKQSPDICDTRPQPQFNIRARRQYQSRKYHLVLPTMIARVLSKLEHQQTNTQAKTDCAKQLLKLMNSALAGKTRQKLKTYMYLKRMHNTKSDRMVA